LNHPSDKIQETVAKTNNVKYFDNRGMNSGEKKVEYKNKVLPVPPSPIEMTTGPRKRRALVIEDSCVVRKSLVRALDRLGFEVSHAANGMEGLELPYSTWFCATSSCLSWMEWTASSSTVNGS
jgi:PleD family two-component response regulator